VTAPSTWHDIMGVDATRPSRWDHGDGEAAIHALDVALEKAGLPGAVDPALRVLARVEELVAAGRTEREKARHRLEEANRRLLGDGVIDVAEYGAVLTECAPWIDENAPASAGVGEAARQVRSRATAMVFGMASTIHQQLTAHCRDVVAVIAAVPAPPAEVWSAQTIAQASTLMIRAGREADWAKFVRLSDEWSSVHAAGRLLRETGVFQSEMMFSGPSDLCTVYLNWSSAVGEEQIKQVPGPLRVRRAHDLGWVPGLWLKSDHDAYAADRDKPKRRPLFADVFAGRSSGEPRPEFS
jgi:hypothetical protein